MNSSQFYSILVSQFNFQATEKQSHFFAKMAQFATSEKSNELFLLKGFAGTGKTTIISTLVNNLHQINLKFVLLAPTGRAAKVIANYSDKQASTIHKKIYFTKKNSSGNIQFTLQQNKHKNTIFIVDEASMIADYSLESTNYENTSLLNDLMQYVHSGSNCKLIFVGDTAQLPPVNCSDSPALNADYLQLQFDKNVIDIELDQVMRQQEKSGILFNATQIRELLQESFLTSFQFKLKGFSDCVRLTDGYDIQDAINQAYSNFSIEDTTFIVRSNKRANQYNQQIRTQILGKESEISTGDFLMIVKNNYFWLKETDEAGFIANGDIVEILSIKNINNLYGFSFAQVTLRMVDYPKQIPFETIIMLDTLSIESASLTYEQSNNLYQEVLKDYETETTQYKKVQKVKNNPYFNALQVKFSYAITCHKSQGGQWNTVFIEQPFLPDGITLDYVRWLYTAVTRAQNKLYLIGFTNEYFEN